MNRYFWLVFLYCYAELVQAEAADWDCQKNTAGEWTCVTGAKSSPVKSTPTVAPAHQPTPEKPLSASKNSDVNQVKQPPVSAPLTANSSTAVTKPNKPVTDISDKKALPSAPTLPETAPVKVTPPVVADKKPVTAQKPPPVQTTDKTAALKSAEKPPAAVQPPANRDGWTCAANTENATWDCSLAGIDPKGETTPVSNDDSDWRLLDDAFTLQQEKIFQRLAKQLPVDPWQQCNSPYPQPPASTKSQKAARSSAPLNVVSDYAEVYDKEITGFVGNVEVERADQRLHADQATYDTVADVLDTQGNVYYSDESVALFSSSASMQLDANKSALRNVLFVTGEGQARGSAQVAYFDNKELSHYNEAAYTSCRPGNQDWVIHAPRLKMNRETGLGSATDAWLEFKGVPVLYTPYINFPIDNRRTTGFLAPTWGSTDESGFDLSTPFYWNIAPNYDATFRPRYLERRGELLGLDSRYLSELGLNTLKVEYLPYDRIRDEARFQGTLKSINQFSPEMSTNVDLNYVSDDDYYSELGSALSSAADQRYVRSRADFNYNTPGLAFLTRVENYQTIDSTITNAEYPYQKLPQVNLDLSHSFETLPLDVGLNNEMIYFYRADVVNGQRWQIKPYLSAPLGNNGVLFTPKIGMQYNQYVLDQQTPGTSDSIARALPITSLDSGIILEQDLNLFNTSLLHTIEPRAYYLYIPYSNQNDIPVFDSSLYDFTYDSLFRENSFTGGDRIQNANQISLGLTSRLIDSADGLEYLKLGVGEIFYFADRKVTLPPGTPQTDYTGTTTQSNSAATVPQTDNLSNLVVDLSSSFTHTLSAATGMQWNPHTDQIDRTYVGLQYANEANEIVNLGYRYREDELSQSDISFRWPLYEDWYAVGRWQYSLDFNATKESFVGLEKDGCCWRFRVIGRKYINSITSGQEGESQTGIFVQLELKGLTSFGDNVDQFLERNIAGYQRKDY